MLTEPRLTRPPVGPGTAEPVVEIDDGAVALGGRPVLRHIDLSVRAGERVAVLGANGSGKSTLVRTMMGLWPVTSGTVRLFGTDLDRFRDWHRVGFVPQRASAASGVPASVREIVESGRLTRRPLLRPLGRADRAAVAHALDVVGLADRARDGISTLSGGQQQRVLIARALAGEPELFVLDEPTAGVDLVNQQALADALARLAAEGATIVLVAHELGPLAPILERAVVMRDGRVAYDGPVLGATGGADVVPTMHAEHPDEPHLHHETTGRHDHAPHVAGPLDGQEGDRR